MSDDKNKSTYGIEFTVDSKSVDNATKEIKDFTDKTSKELDDLKGSFESVLKTIAQLSKAKIDIPIKLEKIKAQSELDVLTASFEGKVNSERERTKQKLIDKQISKEKSKNFLERQEKSILVHNAKLEVEKERNSVDRYRTMKNARQYLWRNKEAFGEHYENLNTAFKSNKPNDMQNAAEFVENKRGDIEKQKKLEEEKRKSEQNFTTSLNKFATGFSTLFGVGYSLNKAKNFIDQSYHEATSLSTLLRFTGDDARKSQILNATLARYDPDNPNAGYEATANLRQKLLSMKIDSDPAGMGKGNFIYGLQEELKKSKLTNPADIMMLIHKHMMENTKMDMDSKLAFLTTAPLNFTPPVAQALGDKDFDKTYQHVSELPMFSEKNLQDAKELANTWQDITQEMKVATMELMPLFKMIANLAEMTARVVGTKNIFTGDKQFDPKMSMGNGLKSLWSAIKNSNKNFDYEPILSLRNKPYPIKRKISNTNTTPTLSNVPASSTKSSDWLTNALFDLAPSIEDKENDKHVERPIDGYGNDTKEGAMQVTGGTGSKIFGMKNTGAFQRALIKNHKAQVYASLKILEQCGKDTLQKMGLTGASDDILNDNKRMIYANMGTCYNGNNNDPRYAQNLMNIYDKNQASGRVTIDIISSDGTIDPYNQNKMLDILQNGDEIRKAVASAINPPTSQGAVN